MRYVILRIPRYILHYVCMRDDINPRPLLRFAHRAKYIRMRSSVLPGGQNTFTYAHQFCPVGKISHPKGISHRASGISQIPAGIYIAAVYFPRNTPQWGRFLYFFEKDGCICCDRGRIFFPNGCKNPSLQTLRRTFPMVWETQEKEFLK